MTLPKAKSYLRLFEPFLRYKTASTKTDHAKSLKECDCFRKLKNNSYINFYCARKVIETRININHILKRPSFILSQCTHSRKICLNVAATVLSSNDKKLIELEICKTIVKWKNVNRFLEVFLPFVKRLKVQFAWEAEPDIEQIFSTEEFGVPKI